ncbi:MAG: anti-sigma factor antagonist [Lachnospiraceae bacterium]|nr:anti-sigma factor antagonist [Lachnospiraceae bacterium]
MVIHLGEDLDHHNAVYIREMADSYVDKYPIDRIIFDFSGVEFMDSSGIGVIMGRYKQMSYVGGSVFVYGIGKNVDRIFQMSGLYKLVKKWNQAEVK